MPEESKETVTRFDEIAESVYNRSFWFMTTLILCMLVWTFYKGLNNEAVIKIVLDFAENTLWFFVIPVSLRIIGKSILPELSNLIGNWKGKN